MTKKSDSNTDRNDMMLNRKQEEAGPTIIINTHSTQIETYMDTTHQETL